MTDLDLAELERLLDEATPGPWRLCLGGNGSFSIEDANRIAVLCQRADWPHRAAESNANARLMAAAPAAIRSLIARLRTLEAALRAVQLGKLNGLFDAALSEQMNGDLDGVFAEVNAALQEGRDDG